MHFLGGNHISIYHTVNTDSRRSFITGRFNAENDCHYLINCWRHKITENIKRFIKITLWSFSFLILLLTGLILSLQYRPVQSYFGKKAAGFLSRELNAQISIEGLYFKPFTSLQLQKLYVSDQEGDTLFYAEGLEAGFDLARLLQNQLSIDQVTLRDARFHLHIDQQEKNNLAFLIEYFTPPTNRRERKKLNLDLHRIELQNLSFLFRDERRVNPKAHPLVDSNAAHALTQPAIDFGDLGLSNISGVFSDINFSDPNAMTARVQRLKFEEKSGFHLRRLDTRVQVGKNLIELRDLELQTNNSEIRDYILLSFEDYKNFDDFLHKVHLNLEMDNSRIASSDIAFFAPDMHQIQFDAGLSGTLKGTVSDIRGDRISLSTSDQTRLQGQVSITGLPDIERTVFDIELAYLHTNIPEIERMVTRLSERDRFDLPSFLNNFDQLRFIGSFKGHYDDFEVKGRLQTALGELETAIAIQLREGDTYYSGEIWTQEFAIGQLVQAPALGQAGFEAFVDGRGFAAENRNINLNLHAPYIDFNQYRYNNLNAEVSLVNNLMDGNVKVHDPHLRLDVEGFSSIDPDSIVHDLYANVYFADLKNLQFYTRDSLVVHAAKIHSDLQGHDFNDLQGQLNIRNLLFETQTSHGQKHIAEIQATADGIADSRQLRLESDILNTSLSGQVDFYTLGAYFRGMANRYMPSLNLAANKPGVQDFKLDLQINKGFEDVADFISPTLFLADSSTFAGNFSSSSSAFEINVPNLAFGAINAEEIHLVHQSDPEALQIEILARNIHLYGRQEIPYLETRQTLENDQLSYTIYAADTLGQNEANLQGILEFSPDRQINLHSFASDLLLNGNKWRMHESRASIEQNRTYLDKLIFSNQQQRIEVDGYISNQTEDKLNLTFDSFDLSSIAPFLPKFNFTINGRLQGMAGISSILQKPYATADLHFDQLSLDQTMIGNLVANADFDQDRNRINIALSLDKDRQQRLFVGGVYHLNQDENNLDLLARFDQTDLDVLQVILKDLITDVKGSLTGQATITGTLSKLDINGSGQLNEAAFKVNYLQTPYLANGPISMRNTAFIIDGLALRDPRGQQASINGHINMQSPSNPLIQATINTNNFLVLNTDFRDNPLYYGTAYATGRFQFDGPPDDMNIIINARTEENTIFNIPLNTTSSLGNYEFIRFTTIGQHPDPGNQRDLEFTDQRKVPAGLRLNMDLHVTPAATTNIYTDLGELSGRGEGQIALRISSMGDFEMFGDYLINAGKFTFSAQDFINKRFEIKQGGNIRWTGKPTDASIALTAYYEQRTSLSPLYDAAGRTTNEQRVTARAEMELSGNLLRPGINFGLDFPADPYVKDELQSYLSDANNVNQQALSLIVRRSFSPGSTTDFSRELNSTLVSAGTELAFNQLNNLISQSLNLNFIDLNIRSLNDASASLRLFNDRLIFTGGITDLRNQPLNDLNVFRREGIATDAELLYLIRKDGRLVLRGSNRLNTRHFLLNPTDEYISALGLIYRREFDTLSEFFRSRR
ncbi:MAG TPA: translocation/assembly module TamB domain-containing protein [Sphingobacteriaceae bacterium]|nr:translocation/assembly module TamB domain-containing protein [Sphingobacteriaceae bacterium]